MFDISSIFSNIKSKVSDHAPEILLGIGISCSIASTITAVKVTPKAYSKLQEVKKRPKMQVKKRKVKL